LDGLTGSVQASGPGASFFWPTPYATRIEAPEVKVALRQGKWQIEQGRARLNGGTVKLDGGGSTDGGFALGAGLTGVRYRLDYGLSVLVDGQLSLSMPAAERAVLSGRINVERGVLDRDVNLDRELVNTLLAPQETPGTEASALDQIDLDLQVTTVDGVRVKNNVGDLLASWDTIRVTGTAENPVVRGRIDLDPGGLIYAYGQTVRIDRGSLLFRGDPLNDPEIDLATTSSLQDPSIAQLRGYGGGSPLDLLTQQDERERRFRQEQESAAARSAALRGSVTSGATSYYSARLFSALGRSLGLGELSVRPVLVYGETDPSARLTVGRELSPHVSFALSVDLRDTQKQTYVGEFHAIRGLPGFTLQGFSNDEGNSGANLQQVLELGGGGAEETSTEPRLRRLRVRTPKGLSSRRVRRSVRLERKAPVPEGAAFEAEVDVTDDLRRRGYPDPRVRTEVVPVEGRSGWVDINLDVEPGPRVRFDFAGDKPPRSLRSSITGLYRTDFYEPASIDEMRDEAVKAFRSEGHLDPHVEVTVERLRPDDPDAPRRVVIRSEAGRRVKLKELRFPGIAPGAEEALQFQFPGTLSRAELAAALPGADARLLGVLRNLGYPAPRIEGREVENDGDRLTVHLAPGERQLFRTVEIDGAPAGEMSHLTAAQPLRQGDPAWRDQAGAVAAILERDLRDHGYPDAAVQPVLTVSGPAVDLRFQVEPGERFQVDQVAFDERGPSRRGYLAKVADLDPGTPLSATEIDEARGRLFGTGLFSRVTADVTRQEGGAARVSFSLADRPRYRLGYGVRWESGVGESAVVDAVDTNFLGRGITLGLRSLYEPDDKSGRLYLQTGGLLGTDFSLESFLLVRRLFDQGLVEDSAEAALQLARPFGQRTTGRLYARYRTTHLFEDVPLDPNFPIDFDVRRPYMGLQALFEGRNDAADPTTGLFASVDLSGSGPYLGSDLNYARLFGQVQDYLGFGLGGLHLTWAQSLRIGVAEAFQGQEVIQEERFKAGGEYSIRGYETDTIGPREVLGSLVRFPGGDALLVINEELRFPLPFDLSGLVFFDVGQVWADRADFGKDLATSTGLGLRARTPLGLLRMDLGIPLDRRPGDPEYKLYFGFGNAF
jgi:outer membrane protein assembly factor BamA